MKTAGKIFLKKSFTLIELLVVIAIIMILAGILFPALQKAKDSARGITCKSNLKQTGTIVNLYLSDYGETFPPYVNDLGAIWTENIGSYCPGPSSGSNNKNYQNNGIASCPSMTEPPYYGKLSFSYNPDVGVSNPRYIKPKDIKLPISQALLVTDTYPKANRYYMAADVAGMNELLRFRHFGSINVLFTDSHVGDLKGPLVSSGDNTFRRIRFRSYSSLQ